MNHKTLKASLDTEYDIQEVNFQFPGININFFSIKDVNKLLDQISDEEYNKDERLPYWAEIWPSSIALASFMATKNLTKKTVLELGSGLGLTGLTAGLKGGDITFSDYEDIALKFCELNATYNQLKAFKTSLIDWRSPGLNESFDLILAADVIYEKSQHSMILNMLRKFLKVNGKCYIAEPNRKIAIDFFYQLENEGFHYQKYLEKVTYKNFNDYISIYEIYPK